MSEMQEQAQIFVDLFGEWNNMKYIFWINDMIARYTREHGLREYQPIADREDFLRFLREEGAKK